MGIGKTLSTILMTDALRPQRDRGDGPLPVGSFTFLVSRSPAFASARIRITTIGNRSEANDGGLGVDAKRPLPIWTEGLMQRGLLHWRCR